MPKKTIAALDVASKNVLIRVDFNVPLKDTPAGKTITDDRRIAAALPTIKSVLDRGGRAILMSHLGRPEGTGYDAASSLKPCAERLSQLLGKPVAFPSTDCTDDASLNAVNAMKNGECLLLENLRHHKAEQKSKPEFAEKIARYGHIYCNDAFGTCHREDSSMVAVPRIMKQTKQAPCVTGFLVEKEIKYLSDALSHPKAPFVVVLGGAKVSDKLPAIHNLLPKADHILIGGAMAYTFIKALGHNVGKSRVEEDKLADAKAILEKAAHAKVELHLPTDHVCAPEFAESASPIEIFTDHIKDGFMGLDIGPKTQSHYAAILRKAGTVVWNGPMGVFEWPAFRIGTKTIADACVEATKHGATTIVGGGDSAAAAEQFNVAEKLSHVSTGGGASLEMLEGKKFASVELLDEA